MEPHAAHQKGATALIAAMAVGGFAIVLLSSTSAASMGTFGRTSERIASEQTFQDAEAGLQEALYRLWLTPNPGTFTPPDYPNVTVTIAAVSEPNPLCDSGNPYPRSITSRATDPSTGVVRKVRMVACSSAFAGGFDYAVQGGAGGIFMDPNSYIVGRVYSNANITGGNNAEVKPLSANRPAEVWIAGTNTLDNVDVLGAGSIVRAHTISNSAIGGIAYYQNIIGEVTTNAGNDTCAENENGPYCFDNQADPPPKALPITEADVNQWKEDISNTGTILSPNPSECPAGFDDGSTYCVTTNTTIGNVKIDGNLYVGRNGDTDGATLTLTGNLWVEESITFDNNVNNGKVKIDPSLGAGSVVVISDETINIENNYPSEGSGDPRSFLLVLSTSTDGIDKACNDPGFSPAIYASNNSSSIIFSAIKGMLKVKNNGHLNAAAVQKLCLENGSNVTFNENLAAFAIPSGGGNDVGTALGTWEEL